MIGQIITFLSTVNWTQVVPIFISFLALVFSGIALWKTSLSRFKAIFIVGDLRLRIYPIKNGKQQWFIASVDIPIDIANDGAQPGRITDMRILVHYPDLPVTDHWEVFLPKWDVDSIKFRQRDEQDRFRWIKDTTLSDWMPFIVLSKQIESKHFIFETRWDKPVIQKKIVFVLEVKTNANKKWSKIDEWELSFLKEMWSELTEVGTSIGTSSKNTTKEQGALLNPPDLHKYTGTVEKIPRGGFKTKPSYMNYPKKKHVITG